MGAWNAASIKDASFSSLIENKTDLFGLKLQTDTSF